MAALGTEVFLLHSFGYSRDWKSSERPSDIATYISLLEAPGQNDINRCSRNNAQLPAL